MLDMRWQAGGVTYPGELETLRVRDEWRGCCGEVVGDLREAEKEEQKHVHVVDREVVQGRQWVELVCDVLHQELHLLGRPASRLCACTWQDDFLLGPDPLHGAFLCEEVLGVEVVECLGEGLGRLQ